MYALPEKFIVFDIEHTAWEGSIERGFNNESEYREIIQIGAVKVENFKEVDTLLVYVKPTINPTLSKYIISLTGITQEDIDTKGKLYEEAQKQFLTWRGDLATYSFGEDEKFMKENNKLNNINFSFPEKNFFNAREIFEEQGINTTEYMSSTIPKAFGLIPPANAHTALSDARSILIALKAVYT